MKEGWLVFVLSVQDMVESPWIPCLGINKGWRHLYGPHYGWSVDCRPREPRKPLGHPEYTEPFFSVTQEDILPILLLSKEDQGLAPQEAFQKNFESAVGSIGKLIQNARSFSQKALEALSYPGNVVGLRK